MNRTYKVIWSKARHCYVVVSELTKSQHKSSSKSELISANVHRGGVLGKAAVAAIVAGLLTFGSYGLADAAGPAATENGPASKADGIASIAVGVGDQVVANKGKMYQGATAIAAGTLNVIDAAAEVNFDGVANSVIGQVNYTKNANAAVIMGAGNKVTNSYKDVKLDEKTLQALRQAYQQNNMQKVTEILQKAVPNSGGQVMVMGGGNTVDYAQSSQVMGVSNILKGTKDSISTYNLVDGFQNKVTNSQNTYVVGTKNRFVNMANSIVLGDNNNRIANNTDRIMKDTIVIGDGNTVQNGDESIAIGKNITIQRDGGNGYEYDTGNVAIGSNAYISSYVNQGDSIAIGKNASVINMNGSLEQAFAFGRPMGKEYSGSIAIGQNSYARSGSTMIGIHDYQGTIGDLEVDFTKGKSAGSSGIGNYQESIDATTIGNNSYNNGVFSTVVGSYTAVSGLYHNQKWGEKPYGVQNFCAAVLGSLNSVEGLSSTEHNTAGMADSILGSANRTKNANGTIMVGAGNVVEDSINDFDASEIKTKNGIASPNALSEAMRTSIKNANGGGAAAIVGNGNEVKKSTNVAVMGSKNSVTSAKNSQIFGDNRVVTGADGATIDGAVIIGSADATTPMTTDKKNVTILGYNANAIVEGGVALGAGSVASVNMGAVGYDLAKGDHSKDTTGVWKSKAAAVSVGQIVKNEQGQLDAEKTITRQITGVAAGSEDTDAVNVAQLKAVSDTVDASKTKYYSVRDIPFTSAQYAAYTNEKNDGAKEMGALAAGYMTYAGGIASTVTGSLSGVINQAAAPGSQDFRGATALSYGTFNINNNSDKSGAFSGVANSIVGQANMTTDSNAALIYGAGNVISNSYRDIDITKMGAITGNLKDPKALGEALQAAVPTSGGQVMAFGGGNVVDNAYMTQVMGVGNTVKGNQKKNDGTWSSDGNTGFNNDASSQLNYIDGFYTTLINGKNDYLIGAHNTVTGDSVEKNHSNIVIGDNHTLENQSNNIILGSADRALSTAASQVTIVGHNANATVEGGVALGAGSVASREAGVAGYDPATKKASEKNSAIWKATNAAVSVGKADGTMTRQITGVAAGLDNTDAVNVAQLKQVSDVINNNINANKVHYYSVKSKYQGDGSNYNNDGAKGQESIVLGIGSSSDAGYSTVIGMGSSAKKRGTSQASGMYDTVVGQYLDTTGSYNSVFGTFYQNGSIQQLTQVYGDRNTVLGAGNIVGIGKNNTKVKSDENVVIGVKNSVEGSGSIIVGNATTVNGQDVMNATSFGHVNTIYDKQEGGGQWGVALGNHLTVKGEYALAVGNNSTAQGDQTVAVGYNANASVAGGAAIGSGSVASVDKGVEGYKPNSSVDTSTDPAGTWKSTDAAVSVGKADGSMTRQITGVAAGTKATDAVNVAQLKSALSGAKDGNDTLKSDTNALTLKDNTLSMNVEDTAGHKVSGSVDLSQIAKAVDTNTTYTLTGEANPDNNTTTITLNDNKGNKNSVTVATKDTRNTVKAGENVTLDTKDNADGSHEYTVNVKADGKVESGSTKIVSGGTVYNETRVAKDGNFVKQSNTAGENLSALDNQVTANTESIYHMNGRISDLDNRVNKVGAGAAALAALHPLDFDPDDKWDFAVGYGNYRNANSVALGAFYRPNEDTMFSLGTNFGNGENMFNAGLSFKIGQGGSGITTSKTAMAKKIESLENTVDQQDKKIAELEALVKEQGEMIRQYVGKK